MRHSLADLIANADRLADEFEHYDPKPDDFDASLPPLMAVKLAAFRRADAEKELAAAIRAAREAHLSWRELGEAIGTSGEAARQATPLDALHMCDPDDHQSASVRTF